PLETRPHRLDDRHDGLAERFANLLVGDDDGLRDAVDQVATLDLHRPPIAAHRVGGTERDLDLLGPPLTDEEIVVLANVLDDRLVHLVCRLLLEKKKHDAAERDHRDLSLSTADVDYHVTLG